MAKKTDEYEFYGREKSGFDISESEKEVLEKYVSKDAGFEVKMVPFDEFMDAYNKIFIRYLTLNKNASDVLIKSFRRIDKKIQDYKEIDSEVNSIFTVLSRVGDILGISREIYDEFSKQKSEEISRNFYFFLPAKGITPENALFYLKSELNQEVLADSSGMYS